MKCLGLEVDDWVANLSTRTRNCLAWQSLVTESDVRAAFIPDLGRSFSKIPNMGQASIREVAEALGHPVYLDVKQEPAPGTIRWAITFLENNGYKVVKRQIRT